MTNHSDDYEDEYDRPEETKNEAFTRIMKSRKTAVIRRMLPICKLSATTRYDFTREEVEAHFGDIQRTLDTVKSRFDAILDEQDIYNKLSG